MGKTTVARSFLSPEEPSYFDLEDPSSLARLANPQLALNQKAPLTVIDEIQRQPELFPVLRVLADAPDRKTSWLVLGSASPLIIKGVSESLAGRIEMLTLSGLSIEEIGTQNWQKRWFRGGFPRSYLAESERDSWDWRKNFLATVIERDIPALGVNLPGPTLMRLWTMLAHYHGQVWTAAEPARSLGISETTVHRLTEYFEGLYLIRLLRPWHANLQKRQVKSPKLYVRDSGLAGALLGISTPGALVSHPKSGALWEGMVIEEILSLFHPDQSAFWGTHNGAELDLLVECQGRRIGFEVKSSAAPKPTPSMRIAITDLGLEQIFVIHQGLHRWDLAEQVTALPLSNLLDLPAELGLEA